jgi:hypothetical protein
LILSAAVVNLFVLIVIWCVQVLATTSLSETVKNGTSGMVTGFQKLSVADALSLVEGSEFYDGMGLEESQAKFMMCNASMHWPIVEFYDEDGQVTQFGPVPPKLFTVNDCDTNALICSRVQLPLLPAYAMTIHKVGALLGGACDL